MSRLQKWANEHKPSDDMIWKDAYWRQIMFVRDKVAGLLARTYTQYRDLVDVVSTHTSKSIICPVYFIDLNKDGVNIWMRYNYFNWNISVLSDERIDCDFLGCFDDRNHNYCFCEGMEKWKFGTYAESKFRFTVCIDSDYDVYVFFRALKHFLKIVPTDL